MVPRKSERVGGPEGWKAVFPTSGSLCDVLRLGGKMAPRSFEMDPGESDFSASQRWAQEHRPELAFSPKVLRGQD
jgi:hypothetical protein